MEKSENTEIQITKTFHATIGLLWEVWTNPEHIVNWWGPDGFTTKIQIMDVIEEGEWKLTMLGPDGTSYPNRSIFREVVPFEKIVFEHFNPHFITTVFFRSKGVDTQIDWTMRFDTAEMRETIIKTHKADEGQKKNIEKLENYLSKYRQQFEYE